MAPTTLPPEVLKAGWYAELFRRALAETQDLGEALLVADLALSISPMPPAGWPGAARGGPPEPSTVGSTAPPPPARLSLEEAEVEIGHGRPVNKPWQGLSGRWFVKNELGKVHPLSAPEGSHPARRWPAVTRVEAAGAHGQGSSVMTQPGDHAPEPKPPAQKDKKAAAGGKKKGGKGKRRGKKGSRRRGRGLRVPRAWSGIAFSLDAAFARAPSPLADLQTGEVREHPPGSGRYWTRNQSNRVVPAANPQKRKDLEQRRGARQQQQAERAQKRQQEEAAKTQKRQAREQAKLVREQKRQHVRSSKAAQATARLQGAQILDQIAADPASVGQEHIEALSVSLEHMTVEQLRGARQKLEAGFGGARVKAGMVEALRAHLRQKARQPAPAPAPAAAPAPPAAPAAPAPPQPPAPAAAPVQPLVAPAQPPEAQKPPRQRKPRQAAPAAQPPQAATAPATQQPAAQPPAREITPATFKKAFDAHPHARHNQADVPSLAQSMGVPRTPEGKQQMWQMLDRLRQAGAISIVGHESREGMSEDDLFWGNRNQEGQLENDVQVKDPQKLAAMTGGQPQPAAPSPKPPVPAPQPPRQDVAGLHPQQAVAHMVDALEAIPGAARAVSLRRLRQPGLPLEEQLYDLANLDVHAFDRLVNDPAFREKARQSGVGYFHNEYLRRLSGYLSDWKMYGKGDPYRAPKIAGDVARVAERIREEAVPVLRLAGQNDLADFYEHYGAGLAQSLASQIAREGQELATKYR